ncbi:NAD(P)-dependent oxidoreductase [Mucilaginibacter agri]|uniref:NAD(P)H-binding protein n=1 Tax=Mucilaginibacter agri TaxID=2695265 RepID=A0A965ZEI8_9SPHI|nr:NAD(P)H-binding protein [Mucilaginibacter agri]NCD69405.1 NAD(P)H-binding protein [Mucilaginibacter agri]
MDQQYKVALLGATGKAGKYILQELLNRGYKVKALVRKPYEYTITHPLLEILHGDIKNQETAHTLIDGCNVIISAIGPRKDEPLISSLSTQNILNAMQEFSIKRYITLAGLNLDIPGDYKSEANKAKSDWMRQNFPDAVADRQKAYDILVESEVDWTMIRVPWIEQTDERRGIKVDLYDCPGEKISTTDLADFVIREIEDRTFLRESPFVVSS